MDAKKKKELLEELFSSEEFKSALDQTTSSVEKEKIKTIAQEVFLNVLEGITTMHKIAKENPEKMAEVAAKYIPKK